MSTRLKAKNDFSVLSDLRTQLVVQTLEGVDLDFQNWVHDRPSVLIRVQDLTLCFNVTGQFSDLPAVLEVLRKKYQKLESESFEDLLDNVEGEDVEVLGIWEKMALPYKPSALGLVKTRVRLDDKVLVVEALKFYDKVYYVVV